MPILKVYVDDRTMQALKEESEASGRTVEELTKSSVISNSIFISLTIDRAVVASLTDAYCRARLRKDNDSKKYAKALLTVLSWYMPSSDFLKLER